MSQRGQQHNGDETQSSVDEQQMYDILRRQQAASNDSAADPSSDNGDDIEDSDDDIDSDTSDTDLATRLHGIDIDDPDAVWHSLSAGERNEFEKLVRSDDVHALIPAYEPWWCTPKRLVQDLAEDSNRTNHHVPFIHPSIVDFSAISTKPPADCVRYNLTNILAAYALVVRCYNGDHVANAHATANLLIAVCANLSSNANFSTQHLAIESVASVADTFGLTGEMANVRLVLRQDVERIHEDCVVIEALSDVHRVLAMAKIKTVPKGGGGEFSRKFLLNHPTIEKGVGKTKLNVCIRKLEYFLSYAKDKLK